MKRSSANLFRRVGMLLVSLSALALALVWGARAAHADEATLQKVDDALNRWKTLDYKYKITTKKGGDVSNVLKLRMRMKDAAGVNQQLIEIFGPADMKGTKVLTASPTQMYIYLPAMKKIRRIASHVTEQGFLGTALSQRDMTLTRYGDKYNAKIDSDGAELAMTLTAKSGDAPYPKLQMKVDKKIWLPTEIKYFNDGGKVIKTETRSKYECDKDYCNPREMVMTDHTAGVSSKLELKKFKINPELKDDLFSKRSLMH